MTTPGDFSVLPISESTKEMLEDAYNAITRNELWDYMKTYEPNKGFMFSEPSSEILRINNSLKYDGHSGASYSCTMREMQFIAKHGWKSYVESIYYAMKEEIHS